MVERIITRSGHQRLTSCKRYFLYEQVWDGTGLVAALPSLDLVIGIATHSGLEALLRGAELQEALERVREAAKEHAGPPEAQGEERLEQLAQGTKLAEAFVVGWHHFKMAEFLEEYELVTIEKEVRLSLSANIILAARADIVVRRRLDGKLLLFNWKTGSYADFYSSYKRDPQMWTEAVAMEDDLKEEVESCFVEGFYKGKKEGGFFTSSPLLWGYQKGSSILPKWVAGAQKRPMWRLPEHEWHEWIRRLPSSVVDDIFIRSLPIYHNREVVEEWLRGVVDKETMVQYALEEGRQADLLRYFGMEPSSYCDRCPFEKVCFGRVAIEELKRSGFLQPRVDHHQEPT